MGSTRTLDGDRSLGARALAGPASASREGGAYTDLTSFVTQSALREADAVIAEADVIKISERDFARVLDLLDNPPKANAKLRAAAASLPKDL